MPDFDLDGALDQSLGYRMPDCPSCGGPLSICGVRRDGTPSLNRKLELYCLHCQGGITDVDAYVAHLKRGAEELAPEAKADLAAGYCPYCKYPQAPLRRLSTRTSDGSFVLHWLCGYCDENWDEWLEVGYA